MEEKNVLLEQIEFKGGELDPLFEELNIKPNDVLLYQMALTHSSCNGLIGIKHEDYQRLEFLGDSLIGYVVSSLSFSFHPEMEQGSLSILKAQLIRTESEADYGRKLGLDRFIKVGPSFTQSLRDSNPLMEDVFEAFVGAILLDQGKEFAYDFVEKLFRDDIKESAITTSVNPKSRLQEAMQAEHKNSVDYKCLEQRGPAHQRVYVSAVYFEGQELGRGEGSSKQASEIEAAKDALKGMEKKTALEEYGFEGLKKALTRGDSILDEEVK